PRSRRDRPAGLAGPRRAWSRRRRREKQGSSDRIMARIRATLMTDPGCPWAYSAEPSMHALRWRYGDQLDWRLVTIGLTETAAQYEERGYTPALVALARLGFQRFGMPFAPVPKARLAGTGRACRATVAVRPDAPGKAWLALRA